MTNQEILTLYVKHYAKKECFNKRVVTLLDNCGLREVHIFSNFHIGYSDGSVIQLIDSNPELVERFEKLGLLANGKDALINHVLVPVLDLNKAIVNIAGYNPYPQTKNKVIYLNNEGIFNEAYLKHQEDVILTETPIEALVFIQTGYANTTFLMPDDAKYLKFVSENNIRNVIFTNDGKARLFYDLTSTGISTRRIPVDFSKLTNGNAKSYLDDLLMKKPVLEQETSDSIRQIERGFLFQFPHLKYRVLGNFDDPSFSLKINIKAYSDKDSFVDYVDLYKSRNRQTFIYNLMDKFNIRDQIQLEQDLNQIMTVLENHREKRENEKKKSKPVLTDSQKDIGMKFLTNPRLEDEIDLDITELGYVRERKIKLLLYLVMVSRLMDNPLHTVIVSRASAGKSQAVDIIEELCPPEDLMSISDLSPMAFYYFGENDLKNKLVVVGEREGSESSEYPIRELISKKSITKAVPMKDKITGEIKTERITVNGPIAFIETTTNGEINQENLSRYFVLGVDETEEQTRLIHESQRFSDTLEGFMKKQQLAKIIEKHVYAQRLLRPVYVFNPFARELKFPSSKLKTRRDHQKFLRLIKVICFLHQYQRKVKKMKLENNEQAEYIECTPADYKLAYELLKDGILDNTLDDIPRTAKELFQLLRRYLNERAGKENQPVDKLVFERKEIREYTSWTFVQVRNNMRILKDYEYIHLVPGRNGQPHKYRLSLEYSDANINDYIFSPAELENRLKNPN